MICSMYGRKSAPRTYPIDTRTASKVGLAKTRRVVHDRYRVILDVAPPGTSAEHAGGGKLVSVVIGVDKEAFERPVYPFVRLFAALAIAVQWVAWLLFSAAWTDARNMSEVGCGYSGTCTDEGLAQMLVLGWVVVPLIELGVGLVVLAALSRVRSGRTAALARVSRGRVELPPRPIAWSFILGCVLLVVMTVQSELVTRFSDRTTAQQARHAVHLILGWVAVDGLLALGVGATVTWAWWRRLRTDAKAQTRTHAS
jgi:hypothetical protein